MAEILSTSGIVHHLEELIKNSTKKLILVTPYLQISKNLFIRLKDANRKGITIVLVFREWKLKQEQITLLSKLSNLELYIIENLHAKCYLNENGCIIGSMNMYQASYDNVEMGILLKKEIDVDLYSKVLEELGSIRKNASKITIDDIEPIGKSEYHSGDWDLDDDDFEEWDGDGFEEWDDDGFEEWDDDDFQEMNDDEMYDLLYGED